MGSIDRESGQTGGRGLAPWANNSLPPSSPSAIPPLEFRGTGEPLVFLHANGYPPECYRPLLELLAKEFRVSAMLQRPLWPGSNPQDFTDWRTLSGDLLNFLERNHSGPVFCVGHSMGGTALVRAALYAPNRFSAIVLLDPVLFPPYIIFFWQVIRSLGCGYRLLPLVATTHNRRRRFNDLERLFDGYRRKPVFRFMNDQTLKAYIKGIACQRENGFYELCYPVEWETRIYMTSLWADMEIWRGLPDLSVPVLIIRGEQSNTFWASTARMVRRKQPRARLAVLADASHLVPLERPVEVQALIHSFLKENA
jgi:pimeloyl-ACP methyl ester carboxylesterase